MSGQQSQISEAEQQIAEQRANLQEQQKQVENIQTPQRSIAFQFAVLKNNRELQPRIEHVIAERQRIKQEGLQSIQTAREQISTYEQNVLFPAKAELQSAQLEMSEWKQAEALAGTEYGGLASQSNPSVHQKVLQIEEGNKPSPVNQLAITNMQPYQIASYQKGLQVSGQTENLSNFNKLLALKEEGFTPVYSNGSLTGFSDIKKGVQVSSADFGKYISNKPETLSKLQSVGLFEQPMTTSVTDINAQLMGGVQSFSMIQKPVEEKKPQSFLGKLISTGVIGLPGSSYLYNKQQSEQQAQQLKEGGVTGFLFGETGKQFIGIGLPGQKPLLTAQEIQTEMRSVPGNLGFIPRTASYLIPTTPFDVALIAGGATIFKIAPPIAKAGMSAYVAYSSGKQVFNKELPTEERVASGIVGGLGATGVIYEASPFVKGGLAKISPGYKPVVEEAGMKIIADIPRANEAESFNLKLIPPGKEAYGYSYSEQASYIGKTGDVTTSARDLIGLKERVGFNKPIESRETGVSFQGKENFGIFATPFDIQTGMAQTRTSRLGTQSFADLFKFQTQAEVSFKLGRENPQIVVFEKAKITKSGEPGTFKAFGKASSELEVTAPPTEVSGSKISSVSKIATTTIKGQKVDIFSAKLTAQGEKSLTTSEITKSGVRVTSSELPSKKVSELSMFSLVSSSEPTRASSSLVPSINSRVSRTPREEPTYSFPQTTRRGENYSSPVFSISSNPPRYTNPRTTPSIFTPQTTTRTTTPRSSVITNQYPRYDFGFGKREKRKPRKFLISQPTKYEPSLGSSIFNIKLTGKVPTSGNVNIATRRGTLNISQLRRINLGLSLNKKKKKRKELI